MTHSVRVSWLYGPSKTPQPPKVVTTVASIGLIACSAGKLDIPDAVRACELYTGALFSKARAYVEEHCDAYLILSALHNVVRPDDLLHPYDFSMGQRDQTTSRLWADQTLAQLEATLEPDDTLVVLASAPYRAWLPRSRWAAADVPLAGLGIGQQLGWLKSHTTPGAVRPAVPARAPRFDAQRVRWVA